MFSIIGNQIPPICILSENDFIWMQVQCSLKILQIVVWGSPNLDNV